MRAWELMANIAILAAALGMLPASLAALRLADRRAERAEWRRLAAFQPAAPAPFDPQLLAGLPEPARRYFAATIRPGAPILPVSEITMRGQFSLGTKAEPNYQPMEARQIIAAPHGFLWSMRTRGGLPVAGSDSGRWTRFWLFGLVPVARQGGNPDHQRSAYGRHIAEAAFWSPAALLPGPGVEWEALDDHAARATITFGGLEQAVDLALDPDGRPVSVAFQRWSNANPDKVHRLQPFGGHLSDFREVEGYRVPHRVEAGNMFGTEDYFPFFRAEVTEIRFPRRGERGRVPSGRRP